MEGKKVMVHQQHQPTIKRLQVNPKGDERMRRTYLCMNDICKMLWKPRILVFQFVNQRKILSRQLDKLCVEEYNSGSHYAL